MTSIILPANPKDDLAWKSEIERARLDPNKLFFEIDFGWKNFHLELDLESSYSSLVLALEQFTKVLWPEFKDRIEGVLIFRGSLEYSLRFLKIEKYQNHYEEWLGIRPDNRENALFFSVTLFTEFLHRLTSILPDTLSIYCQVDATTIPERGFLAQLLSKERFSYFNLIVTGSALPQTRNAKCGIVLPSDEKWNMVHSAHLERLMAELSQKKISFRLIAEPYITQEWDGLDTLYLLQEAVTPQGRRMAQGFAAAFGQIIYY